MLFTKSSFLDGFDIPTVSHEDIKKQLNKTTKTKRVSQSINIDKMPLSEKLAYIESEVNRILGRYKGFIKVMSSENEFAEYIDKCIDKGEVAFDTETNNSLDPLTCKLMGLCFYIENTRPVYVPINHTKPGTDELLENQVSEKFAKEQLQKLADSGTKLIYHNGKFDIRVVRNTLGVTLPIWWDTMIAAQLLDENDDAKLKNRYQKLIDPTIDTYNIEELFLSLPYAWVDPEIFGIYAAIDAYDTLQMQRVQQQIFKSSNMKRLYNLFRTVEMPVISVVSKMEDAGVTMDSRFVEKLQQKYQSKIDQSGKELWGMLEKHKDELRRYEELGKIDSPVNLDSPAQLNIVLYDVLKTPVPRAGRKTDKGTLEALKTPFTEALLSYRHLSKLQNSFLKPLPTLLSPRDGKLHANFNQMGREEKGVRTGRFSSTDPNLQQIPSKEGIIRMMFMASPGCCIIGSDYSAQEPRLLTHLSGEETLRKAFEEKRDPYATVASLIFNKDYWECMEHWEDGSPNEDGKLIRKKAKGIMLGLLYGMGKKRLATSLGTSVDEAQEMLERFFEMFPKVRDFAASNKKQAIEQGYVEDYIGRQRHLPNASLPEAEIEAYEEIPTNAGVFIECSTPSDTSVKVVDEQLTKRWQELWNNLLRGRPTLKDKEAFKRDAINNKIIFKDNNDLISKALTQCTNARIQGSAATLTKKAMIAIDSDPEMRALGFQLLIPIHDELLGECPLENADRVQQRLTQIMVEAAKPECTVAMSCDPYCVKHWYADEISSQIRKKYKELGEGVESVKQLCEKYKELSTEVVTQMCHGTYNLMTEVIC